MKILYSELKHFHFPRKLAKQESGDLERQKTFQISSVQIIQGRQKALSPVIAFIFAINL